MSDSEAKIQWKSNYKAIKVKENSIYSNIHQLFKKFHTHYNEFENLSIIYGGLITNNELDTPSSLISNIKLDQFINQMEKLDLQRKSERLSVNSKFQIISSNIQKMKALIESFQRDPSDSKLKSIEKIGNEIDSDLVEFKQEERETIEALNAEEKLLNKDLDIFVERIQLLEKQLSEPTHNESNFAQENINKIEKKKKIEDKIDDRDLPPEISEFNHFLNTNGGRYGGWDPEDHQIFLATKSKAGSNKQFLFSEVSKRVPGQTPFTVQQHLNWYEQFLELKRRKQEAIAVWRTDRDQKRIALINQREENELLELEKQDEIARKQWLEEQSKKKEMIQAWKLKKLEEKKKIEKEESLKLQEEKRKEKQREIENQQRKEILQKMKKEKELTEKEKQIEEQLVTKTRPLSATDKLRLEERNKYYAERRQELASRQSKEKELRNERLQKMMNAVHVEGKSDSNRLTSETASQRSRVLDLQKHGADNKGYNSFNIRQVQHRSMPSWRKGI